MHMLALPECLLCEFVLGSLVVDCASELESTLERVTEGHQSLMTHAFITCFMLCSQHACLDAAGCNRGDLIDCSLDCSGFSPLRRLQCTSQRLSSFIILKQVHQACRGAQQGSNQVLGTCRHKGPV